MNTNEARFVRLNDHKANYNQYSTKFKIFVDLYSKSQFDFFFSYGKHHEIINIYLHLPSIFDVLEA